MSVEFATGEARGPEDQALEVRRVLDKVQRKTVNIDNKDGVGQLSKASVVVTGTDAFTGETRVAVVAPQISTDSPDRLQKAQNALVSKGIRAIYQLFQEGKISGAEAEKLRAGMSLTQAGIDAPVQNAKDLWEKWGRSRAKATGEKYQLKPGDKTLVVSASRNSLFFNDKNVWQMPNLSAKDIRRKGLILVSGFALAGCSFLNTATPSVPSPETQASQPTITVVSPTEAAPTTEVTTVAPTEAPTQAPTNTPTEAPSPTPTKETAHYYKGTELSRLSTISPEDLAPGSAFSVWEQEQADKMGRLCSAPAKLDLQKKIIPSSQTTYLSPYNVTENAGTVRSTEFLSLYKISLDAFGKPGVTGYLVTYVHEDPNGDKVRIHYLLGQAGVDNLNAVGFFQDVNGSFFSPADGLPASWADKLLLQGSPGSKEDLRDLRKTIYDLQGLSPQDIRDLIGRIAEADAWGADKETIEQTIFIGLDGFYVGED